MQISSGLRFVCLLSQVIAIRGKQAKILSDGNLEDLLLFAETSRHPLRNKVIVLLSAKAGRRAGEIAHLTWAMVTDPTAHAIASCAVQSTRDRSKNNAVAWRAWPSEFLADGSVNGVRPTAANQND